MFIFKRKTESQPEVVPAASGETAPTTQYHVKREGGHEAIKAEVHARLIDEGASSLQGTGPDTADVLKRMIREAVHKSDTLITPARLEQLAGEMLDEIRGLGPLEPLLADASISEIMVNSPGQIYVEQAGRILLTDIRFESDRHLLKIIDRIVSRVGRHIDEASPMCDARLPDGSRINAIIPPLALNGPCLTIRRFAKEPLKVEDLVGNASLTDGMAHFLRMCVEARLNTVISGGTGSGKTTVLNVLSSFIPVGERLITIEDAAELQLQQPHVVKLETRQSNSEGQGAITQAELLRNTLRMRPDRIIIGEVRGSEALTMLQAMNTGHEGSMTTIHANTCRDALSRLETMVLMAGMDLPHRAIREQIASSLELIVQIERSADGKRRVTAISELVGMEGDVYLLQEIFKWICTGRGPNGELLGHHRPTGIVPRCQARIEAKGLTLPLWYFSQHPSTNPHSGGQTA